MAAIDRLSREKQTRVAETREATRKRFRPGNLFPEVQAPEGFRLRWVRTHYNGAEVDNQNFGKRRQEGYEPVAATEYPELSHLRDANGNIALSGLVLCKIPTEISDEARQYYSEMANGVLAGVASQYEAGSNRYVKKVIDTPDSYNTRTIHNAHKQQST
jgi:hypothetical protein